MLEKNIRMILTTKTGTKPIYTLRNQTELIVKTGHYLLQSQSIYTHIITSFLCTKNFQNMKHCLYSGILKLLSS